MSIMYCHEHDRHYDTDYDVECPECEIEVADGIFQSRKDYEANMRCDEARDEALIDELT